MPYHVSADVASAWVQAELSNVSRQLGGNLPCSFASGHLLKPPANAPPDTPATPGLDLLAAITNTPRADLDNGTLGRALWAYLHDMTTTVGDAVSCEPERMESARERMRAWGETLREHGIPATNAAKDTPDAPDRDA